MSKPMNVPGMGDLPNPEAIYESWWPIIIAITCGVLYGLRQYMKGSRCISEAKLESKVIIITGAAGDIGQHTAVDLAKRGARVYLACHTAEQAKEAESNIRKLSKTEHVFGLQCDLASFKSIEEFATAFKKKEDKLHVLILNAGVMMCPFEMTEDKIEKQFQVNYLGHFLLTHFLYDILRGTEDSRIVSVMAPAYQLGEINFEDLNNEKDYTPSQAFAQSKLALFMFTQVISRRLKDDNIAVNSANPGVTNTQIYRHLPIKKSAFVSLSFSPFMWFLMKSPEDGAQTVIYCAVAEKPGNLTGMLFKECMEVATSVAAMDQDIQEKLFQISLKLTNINEFGKVENKKAVTES